MTPLKLGIRWEFLDAKWPCEVKNKTIYVYLQEDISLLVNKDINMHLPIKWKIKEGAVALTSVDRRLHPMTNLFLLDSEDDGLRITLYNRSYQTVDMKGGDPLCVLRYIG